jgi:hypothetical protein
MRDAYHILQYWEKDIPLTNDKFYSLIRFFRRSFLEDRNYSERIKAHRKPVVLQNEMLSELHNYYVLMQNRPELRDVDREANSSGPVPGVVARIWDSDKSLRSLYDAIQFYCRIRDKEFIAIAVHMAELRALDILGRLLNRAIIQGITYLIS